MAHEIENMFYVGEAPWHKLGVKVEGNINVQEAIVAAGLDWTVGLKPLFTPEGTQVDAQATFRSTDNSILGVVGPTYKPLQNSEAFAFFNPFLESKECTLETAGSLREGKRVWILAKINRADSVIVPQADDKISKYLLLSNSHDGTLSIRVGYTPIRVVCNNTLSLAHGSAQSMLIRIKHKGNVQNALTRVQDAINIADATFEATAEQYRALASKGINAQDLEKYVNVVFSQKATEGKAERSSRVLSDIIPLFEKGRGNDMPGVKGTLWGAYNAVTEYIQYNRGNAGTSLDKRLDATWFGQGMELNKRALTAAVELVKA